MEKWRKDDPLVLARHRLGEVCGLTEASIREIEAATDAGIREVIAKALAVGRPRALGNGPFTRRPRSWPTTRRKRRRSKRRARISRNSGSFLPSAGLFRSARRLARNCGRNSPASAGRKSRKLPALSAKGVKNGDAVNMALDYLLANHPSAYLAGMDVGAYGSAFKTCKGLVDRYGPHRVIDMPLAESSILGFALGLFADRRGADRRVPVRRFLHGGGDATRPERRHLALPHGLRTRRCWCGCPAAAG